MNIASQTKPIFHNVQATVLHWDDTCSLENVFTKISRDMT